MDKYLKTIFTEMCNRVDADYDSIDFQKEDWYYQYEWTQEEENSFIEWVADYLYNNSEARKILYGIHIKNKKLCKKAAEGLIFYCWKIKNKNNI